MSGPTYFKAERPVHDKLAAVGAISFSGAAAAMMADNLFKRSTPNPINVDRS